MGLVFRVLGVYIWFKMILQLLNSSIENKMKSSTVIKMILLSVVINGCTSSKTKQMKIEENRNFSCDAKTASCSVTPNTFDEVKLDSITKINTSVKINYYYDALCGWCYGFSPVISKLKEVYGSQIDINIISGGLFTGRQVGKVNDVAPHIKAGAYKSVELMTQVKFGKTFLEDVFGQGNMILNSVPPTMALCIVTEAYPEKELEFAALLLKAVYFDGINPVDINAYVPYVEKYGIQKQSFLEKMNSKEYEQKAIEEFKTFSKSSYSGMPSITVVKDNIEIPISRGFINYQQLDKRLKQFLN